jgi:hypothetical protein
VHSSENVHVAAKFCVVAEGEELETHILGVLLRKSAKSCEAFR